MPGERGTFEAERCLPSPSLGGKPLFDDWQLLQTEERLPEIAGGISVALARSFKIIDPELKNPQTEHWEGSQRIFDLLL